MAVALAGAALRSYTGKEPLPAKIAHGAADLADSVLDGVQAVEGAVKKGVRVVVRQGGGLWYRMLGWRRVRGREAEEAVKNLAEATSSSVSKAVESIVRHAPVVKLGSEGGESTAVTAQSKSKSTEHARGLLLMLSIAGVIAGLGRPPVFYPLAQRLCSVASTMSDSTRPAPGTEPDLTGIPHARAPARAEDSSIGGQA